MALKYITDKPEEGTEALYEQEGDKFILQVEGAVGVDKLNEFRNNNLKLKEQLQAYGDIDPAKASEALETLNKIDDKKLVDAGKVDEVVQSRTSAMQEAHEKAVGELSTRLEKAEGELARVTIDRALTEAGAKVGLRSSAVDDLINRGRAVFTLKDGAPVALDADGNPRYNTSGNAMTTEDFVEDLVKNAPHLFDESKGSGSAPGSSSASPHNGVNPFLPESKNLSHQAKLLRENPKLAHRLAAQAGVKLPGSITSLSGASR